MSRHKETWDSSLKPHPSPPPPPPPQKKSQKQPFGGHGKLTQLWIDKLTNFCGRAIKDHSGSLQAMERAAWTSFFHSTSQEDHPLHIFRPQDSWCFYQRTLHAGAPAPPHKKTLPPVVGEVLCAVYQRLADPQLLSRCLLGRTQNSNERLHSLLWTSRSM